MTRITLASLGLMGALTVMPGCKKEEAAAPDAGPSTMASAATSAVSAGSSASAAPAGTAVASATADVDNLPAPAAQAAAAAKKATPANYKTELDSIEKELNAIK
jgi:hypothetical protein